MLLASRIRSPTNVSVYRRHFLTLASKDEIQTYNIKKILSFSPQVLYTAVADVKSYEEFLPYCKESTITARDPETDKPTKAILNVGWGQFEETFESVLKFDKEDTTVIAEAANSKMFKTLYTRWTILPLPNAKNNVKKCAVDFQLKFCFNSSLYNTVSKNFGPSISSIMIGAFTKRAKYLESLKEATSS